MNREVVTLRGIIPGEYIINLYLYDNKSMKPVNAKIIIEKVNPSLKLVFFKNVILQEKDTELTIARFNLNSTGDFTVGTSQKQTLTPYELKGY